MKINNEIIHEIYHLAKGGISNKRIFESLNISKSAYYSNKEIMETVEKAKNELVKEVSSSLLEKANIEKDTTALIFLAKRLNLFTTNEDLSLNNTETALTSLETILASDKLTLEQKTVYRAIISDYLKAYEVVELEKRIIALEEVANDKK